MKGGNHPKKKPKDGQEAFLEVLWMIHGGPAKVSRLIGCSKQQVLNWKNRGGIPLIWCTKVAKITNVHICSLNYIDMLKFCDYKGIPSWKEVIESCKLAPIHIKYILSFKEPE